MAVRESPSERSERSDDPPSTTRERRGQALVAPASSSAPPLSSATPLTEPPPGTFLDRIARYFEGGGAGTPCATMLDLGDVLAADELAKLPAVVAAFYAQPGTFDVEAGVDGGPYSRRLLALFAAIGRQADVVDRVRGFEAYPLGQLLYRDRRGRVHWDRYAWIDGTWRRLFLARIDGATGTMCETFVLYGVPVPLTFRAAVVDGALVLTLVRKWSSPLSWFARVVYRTEARAEGTSTQGDFRIPLLGFYVRTEFRAAR